MKLQIVQHRLFADQRVSKLPSSAIRRRQSKGAKLAIHISGKVVKERQLAFEPRHHGSRKAFNQIRMRIDRAPVATGVETHSIQITPIAERIQILFCARIAIGYFDAAADRPSQGLLQSVRRKPFRLMRAENQVIVRAGEPTEEVMPRIPAEENRQALGSFTQNVRSLPSSASQTNRKR